MAQPVRWGILGTGAIAQKFASDLALVRDTRLVAVASRTMARASAFAAAFAIPTALEGCEALARCADIDIIYIATPNSDHAAAALTCIAAKKAVLIEKPMATSVAEARQIAEAADAQGVFCMEAMWMRFTPGVVRAKAMIEAGAIGEVRHLQANLFYPQPYATDSRFFSAALGGGALLDLGVYPISLAIHLLGRPSTIAGSMVTTVSGVDAQATAALGWDNKTAALSCGFTAEGDNSANVIGSQGHLRLHRQFLCPPFLTSTRTHGPQADAPSDHVERRRPARFAAARRVLQPFDLRRRSVVWTPFNGFGLNYQVAEVHRCLASGHIESPRCPLSDSIMALEVIEAVTGQCSLQRQGRD